MDSMQSLLQSLNIGGYTLPNGRFFTPTPVFWDAIKPYQDTMFLDAGCGSGDLVNELIDNGFKAIGCDINMRDGVNDYGRTIQLVNATSFPLTKGMTVLTCRPDHSGWCEPLLERAVKFNCTFIYIGLERNLDLDLSSDVNYEIIARDVGEDGELMLLCNSINEDI